MFSRLMTVVLISSAILVACKQDVANKIIWKKPETQTISCGDYFAETTPNGILYNNVWNKNAAKTFPWAQCLEKDTSTGLLGWSWSWPVKSSDIFAYPQIKLGTSPWAPLPKFNADFPLDSANLSRVVVEHELAIQGNSEHNVATTLWLTDTKEIGEIQNPNVIIAELMIWTYSTPNHMNPAGTHVGDFEVGNDSWEVWVKKNWGNVSGATQNKWTYITFRAKNGRLKTAYDVLKFTRYAVEKNLLPEKYFISDIELGTEIMSGSGLVWVKQFKAIINH